MQRFSLLEKESLQLLFNSDLRPSKLSAFQLFPSFFLPPHLSSSTVSDVETICAYSKGKTKKRAVTIASCIGYRNVFPPPFFKKKNTPVLWLEKQRRRVSNANDISKSQTVRFLFTHSTKFQPEVINIISIHRSP